MLVAAKPRSGLGLIPYVTTSATGSHLRHQPASSQALNVSGVQVEGVFSSITRLKSAITNNRPEDLPSIVESIDADLERLSMARGIVGSRQQSIESIKSISADQQISLKQVESNELDADLPKVISDLTGAPSCS